MNDVGAQRIEDLERVILRLREALALPVESVVRDSAILRFELAFEVAWKTVQFFARQQGFEVSSPRQAFERAFLLGWITDEVLWQKMLAARNMAVHVYREELAEQLYESLPGFLRGFEELGRSLEVVR
jgi:nucleotidyltransferase substrate binding protein (TIGR01987 family)